MAHLLTYRTRIYRDIDRLATLPFSGGSWVPNLKKSCNNVGVH